MRKIIAIIGDSHCSADSFEYKIAEELGKLLVDEGYRVQTGGLGGIMEAAMKGAHSSVNYKDGDTIAIIPSFDSRSVNPYADIVIPTGLDVGRNTINANADAVIAIGGGAGTLSEMASAWMLFKLIIAFENVDGWSSKLANTKIDKRVRYKDMDDKVYGITSPKEAVQILNEKINLYIRKHTFIPRMYNEVLEDKKKER